MPLNLNLCALGPMIPNKMDAFVVVTMPPLIKPFPPSSTAFAIHLQDERKEIDDGVR